MESRTGICFVDKFAMRLGCYLCHVLESITPLSSTGAPPATNSLQCDRVARTVPPVARAWLSGTAIVSFQFEGSPNVSLSTRRQLEWCVIRSAAQAERVEHK